MRQFKYVVIAVLFAAGAAMAGQSVDVTRELDPDGSVEIENLSGSVEVAAWDRNEVHVSGTLGDDTDGLKVTGNEHGLLIEVEIPRGNYRGRRDLSSTLKVSVPRGADVSVETVSASIEVDGVSGDLELVSVSGSVEASGKPAEAELETVSGSIRFTGEATAVSADSVSGSIHLRGVSERVEVSTVSGSVSVQAGAVGKADLESVSGSIEFEGSLSEGARLDAECHSGNVTLKLSGDISARFDLSTFSGRIESDFGPEAKRTSRYAPGKSLQFTLGDGDARVNIESFSGTIRIKGN